ncbi:MAG: hypothetical protein HC767_15130 [Akkermansiaceae bacterium]|nr:hypothetical protein [Akkermansiaceae bacterium]
MTFEELLAHVIEVLQREGRISYRALQRRFDLDDAYLDDVKVELIEAKQLARDENDRSSRLGGAGCHHGAANRSPRKNLLSPCQQF